MRMALASRGLAPTRTATVIGAAVAAVVGVSLFAWTLARSASAPPRQVARTAEAVPPDAVTQAPPAPSPFPNANVTFVGPPPVETSRRPRVVEAVRERPPSSARIAPPPPPVAPTTAQRNDRTAARRVAATPPSVPAIPASAPPHFIESVEVDSTVYGLADRNVEPPIAVLPQQLGSLPAGARREDYYTIEVVVNEQGRVDSARVTETPLELGDTIVVTMSLSAVKSWLFLPATKDGKPVRYRKLIPVSLR